MKIEDVLTGGSAGPRLLGEMLVRRGQIRRYQLNFALKLQEAYKKVARNERLGEIFVEHRVLSDRAIQKALEHQSEMPADSLSQIVDQMGHSLKHRGDEVSAPTQVLLKP